MKKRLFATTVLILIVFYSGACIAFTEKERSDYGILMSAVAFSAEKVIGVYGDNIPNDFSETKFLQLVRSRIPADYYNILEKYPLKVEPKGSYYLLLVFSPESESIILFDYSCTPKVDGPVLLDPVKYDVNKIDSFDKCKTYF